MDNFYNLPISIVVKTDKGFPRTLNYANAPELCANLMKDFKLNRLTILVVSINNQIVWTSLGALKPITPYDLISFFC